MLFFTTSVKADCDLEAMKEAASKVEVTYDVDIGNYNETGQYNKYVVTVHNLTNDIYAYDESNGNQFINDKYVYLENQKAYVFYSRASESIRTAYEGRFVEGNVYSGYTVGTHTFDVYANECTDKLKSITIKITKFNEYSQTEACEGISGDDLSVCGEWFDNRNLSSEDFNTIVEEYKNGNIEDGSQIETIDDINLSFFNKIVYFLKNNYLYIIGGIVLIVIIVSLIVIRQRRGRLE